MRWFLAFCVVALLAYAVNADDKCPCQPVGQVVAPQLPKPMPGPGHTVKVPSAKKEHKVLHFLRHPFAHRKCR